jgi:hypothetical protein
MGEVWLKWGKLNFDKKKISTNLNSKMHRLDNSVSPMFKNTIALDLNCQLELKSVLEAPIKRSHFMFYIMGKTLMGKKVKNRNGGPACGGVQGFTTRQDRWMSSA